MNTKIKAKIKIGSKISQDFSYFKWPNCFPPNSEYENNDYYYETKFPDAEFECEWYGKHWNCVKDGYGSLKNSESYGNGSIFVLDYNGIEFSPFNDEGDWW